MQQRRRKEEARVAVGHAHKGRALSLCLFDQTHER